MKNIIEQLKQAFHKALVMCHVLPAQKPLVKRIWYDEKKGQIFIHTNCRSGLFYLPVKGGEQYSCWLADMFEISEKKLPKTETIYRLMDIKTEAPAKHGT